jgi:hypothetical protein
VNYDLSSLQKIELLIERLRSVHPRMEMQTVATLVTIALKERMTKPDLERRLDMSGGSSMRNISLLRDFNLVAVAPHVTGSILTLTPSGDRFIRSLTEAIEV